MERLAEASGRTVREVVQSLIEKGLASSKVNGGIVVAPDWKKRLMRLLEEMEALPLEGPDDGFTGEDHDDVLYPTEP